jgi:hypothetical protein
MRSPLLLAMRCIFIVKEGAIGQSIDQNIRRLHPTPIADRIETEKLQSLCENPSSQKFIAIARPMVYRAFLLIELKKIGYNYHSIRPTITQIRSELFWGIILYQLKGKMTTKAD